MFQLNSDITIGNYRIQGISEVRIKRSLHSYVDTASITLPAVANVKEGLTNKKSITGEQFADGDAVSIQLGYNGVLNEEFKGFVKKRDLNTPLEITCEGYSYLLRNKKSINESWKSTTVKEILTKALDNTGIKLQVNNDIDLVNIVVQNKTAAEVIDLVIKTTQGALTAFFIEPDTLWVGLLYLPNATTDGLEDVLNQPIVKFQLGYNVIRDNNLKQRTPLPVQINYKNKETKRQTGETNLDKKLAEKVHTKILNHIKLSSLLKILADVNTIKESYTGLEGKLNAFLVPYCLPGYKIQLSDPQYKERNGGYLIESTEVSYGSSGARRSIEMGPKIDLA